MRDESVVPKHNHRFTVKTYRRFLAAIMRGSETRLPFKDMHSRPNVDPTQHQNHIGKSDGKIMKLIDEHVSASTKSGRTNRLSHATFIPPLNSSTLTSAPTSRAR